MKNLLSVTICLLALFVSANFAQKQTRRQTKSKTLTNRKAKPSKPTEFVCQMAANVVALNLSRNEIAADCPAADEACSNNRIIKVKTTAADTGNERYVYTVSAGKIIGESYDVDWDLSGVAPGSYTITVGISQYDTNLDKWAVYGMTKTRTLVIK